jgi:GAF domain-containing protein
VRTCAQALSDVDLFRYDVIVLSLGHNEALALMRPRAWRDGLRALLADLTERAPAATRIFLLPIPVFGPRTQLPPALSRVLDARVEKLDAITAELAEATPGVALIGEGDTYEFQPESSHVYRKWADGVAAQISTGLDPRRMRAGDTADVDEAGRQQAVRDLEALGTAADPALDELTRAAREAFGTASALITLVHADEMTTISTTGVEVAIPRGESFCDITIRRVGHVVIEDATLDSRYEHYPVVTGARVLRFYAGYPIESPDGHRVGAFCVMDENPRSFTPDDMSLLRSLAQRAQVILWQTR